MTKENIHFQAFFFSDDQRASQEARKLLNESGVSFEELSEKPINGYLAPTLISREGEFEGLDRIREFVQIAKTRSELFK